LDRTSGTRQLGQKSWDSSDWTNQPAEWKLTWTGQPGHDNVWKTYIFARVFTKTFTTKIFVNISAKMLRIAIFSRKRKFSRNQTIANFPKFCEIFAFRENPKIHFQL
jgi:hypothetical protein